MCIAGTAHIRRYDAYPVAWARNYTPILRSFAPEYGETEPLAGHRVVVATTLEAKCGVFVETLRGAGTEALFTPAEPQSTRGDVVEAVDTRDGVNQQGITGSNGSPCHQTSATGDSR